MPRAPKPSGDFERWETSTIRAEVRAFVKHRQALGEATFGAADIPDLVQEATLKWWLARRHWRPDGGASPKTYLKRVVRNFLCDRRDAARAESRGGGERVTSLDESLDDAEDGATRADLVPDLLADTEAGAIGHAMLASAWARLTPRQRQVVQGRRQGYEMADLARRLRVHRDTLYADLERIRAIFSDAGLAD